MKRGRPKACPCSTTARWSRRARGRTASAATSRAGRTIWAMRAASTYSPSRPSPHSLAWCSLRAWRACCASAFAARRSISISNFLPWGMNLPPRKDLGAWAAERSAQVKEEPAQRAGDTEQNALPLGLLAGSTNTARTATKKKRFNKINVELKDGVLRVEGEKRISKMVDGLGGEFTYCTLGEPLDIEKLLSGESLPAFEALGAWLFHTATGGTPVSYTHL